MALRARYVLKVDLDYRAGVLTTTETIDLTNESGLPVDYYDLSVLAHHFGRLSISGVVVDGQPASVSFPNDADMRVFRDQPQAPGARAQIAIAFTAIAGTDVSDSLLNRLSRTDRLMQVSGWYPVLSDGHGLRAPGDSQFTAAADYRVELTHERGVQIAAPGDIVASSPTSKTYVLSNAREFAFAASTDFVSSTATGASGTQVEVYYLPATPGAPKASANAASAIDYFSTALGPYPYRRFVVVQSTRARIGQEYSGIVFIGRAYLHSRDVVAHEVAHQWWYGIVGNDQLNEPWLDESFAELAGHDFSGTPVPAFCSERPVDSAVYDFPDLPAGVTLHDCGSYDQTVYYRGAWFLAGLRELMGTSQFSAALRAIVAENRFGILTAAGARAAFLRFADDPIAVDAYMSLYLG